MTLAQLAILADASFGRAKPQESEGTFADLMALSSVGKFANG